MKKRPATNNAWVPKIIFNVDFETAPKPAPAPEAAFAFFSWSLDVPLAAADVVEEEEEAEEVGADDSFGVIVPVAVSVMEPTLVLAALLAPGANVIEVVADGSPKM